MRVLVTRPAEEQARTAAALRRRGHVAVSVPVMQVRGTGTAIRPARAAGVIVTSVNALRLADPESLALLHHLPLFAVGDRTAEAAREAGFGTVANAGGDAEDLARLLERAAPASGTLLYLTGRPRRDTLERKQALHDRLQAIDVYLTEPAPDFAERMLAAAEQGWPEAVVHFSGHQAALFAASATDPRLAALARARHCVISASAARPLAGLAHVAVAEAPTQAALLDLLG
jgi:uroporphyrinogen-III synthase